MKFTAYDKGGIMSAAKDVTRCMGKKETILKQKEVIMQKLQALDNELNKVDEEIAYYSKPVKDRTGYNPMDLVVKSGRTFVFKYPQTIIPSEETTTTTVIEESVVEPQPVAEVDLDAEEDKDWDDLIEKGIIVEVKPEAAAEKVTTEEEEELEFDKVLF